MLDKLPDGTDIRKLFKAISKHETQNCTLGSAKFHNCVGIRNRGEFVRYADKEECYQHFKKIWTAYYGKFPDFHLASKWSGNKNSRNWLITVKTEYNKL